MQLQRTDPLGGSGNGAPITGIANLDAEYTWSAEGTLLTLKYPDLRTGHPNQQLAEKGNTLTYQTDWLRRYSGMTETSPLNPGTPTTLVSGMQYGISGELTSMTYNQPTQSSNPVVTETRQYNLLGQLTQITAVQGANTVTNLQYVFPTGTNNGRISSMVNIQSGETVTYTYDALNRLTNAVGTGWSEAYAFDGFGNLTQKGAQSIGVLAASNRLTGPGVAYDSNGNQTGMQVGTTNVTNSFDIENRLLEVSGQGFRYGFGPDNRKMWTRNASNGNEDYVFWGPQGKPIGAYRASWEWTASSGTLWFTSVVSTRRWMGSKEISATSVLIHDRLSSVVGVSAGGSVSRFRYLPYGEPNAAGGSPVGSHFASYDRTDAGMYYADQRHYRDGVGKFLSADPYQASGGPPNPNSWNRYAYVSNDPVNLWDPQGLQECPPGHVCATYPTIETHRLNWTRQGDEAQRILESTLIDAKTEHRLRFEEYNNSLKLFVSENIKKGMPPECEAGMARAIHAKPGRNLGPVDTMSCLMTTLNNMTILHGGMHTITLGEIGVSLPELGLNGHSTVDEAWVKAVELAREYRMFNGGRPSAFSFRSSNVVMALDSQAQSGLGMTHELLHMASDLSDVDLARALEPNFTYVPWAPGSEAAQASAAITKFLSSCSFGRMP